MSILQMLIAGGGDNLLSGAVSASDNVASPANADARVRVNSNGDIEKRQGAAVTDDNDWIAPKINMASYECQYVPSTGALDIGVNNTFETLNVTREYGIQQAGIAVKNATGTIQIRKTGQATILASWAVTLHCSVS